MSVAQPLVSFIIPCYNHGRFIAETVQSAYNQTYRPIEVIVVDDGSTEPETKTALVQLKQKWSDLIVIETANGGPSVARNIAVRQATGKYLVPLDGDDLIEPHTLEHCIPVLEANEKVAVVYGDNRHFGEKNNYLKQAPFPYTGILLHNTIAFCSVIRKQAYDEVGGLDEWLSKKGLEDWELWIRLHKAGWIFNYVPKLFFRIRTLATSRTVEVANKNLDEIQRYVWNKHLDFVRERYTYLYHEHKNAEKRFEARLRKQLALFLKLLGLKK
jgi:glycosyltransferase involved in cell wall biosynthesis